MIFDQYDDNKDGKLSRVELTNFLQDTLYDMGKERKIQREEVFDFLVQNDIDKDGEIDPSEFKELIMKVLKKKIH